MRRHWMLASTLLIAGCAMVRPSTTGGTLILKPRITTSAYISNTVIAPYTQASINHLILRLFTFDGTEHDKNYQQTILNAHLNNPIVFANLKANTTYRIKAYAYSSTDESALISTTDASSSTDVTLTNDDRPTIATITVKLIDRAFNGQATASLAINNGGFSPVGSESLDIPRMVSILAGQAGIYGSTNGLGTAALFRYPYGITVDSSGNVYIADYGNHIIRKLWPGGMVTTLAGQTLASGSVNATGTAAQFYNPYGVAADGPGNVYVADTRNHLIRKITSAGVVSTLAGQAGTPGTANGIGTSAQFNTPVGVAVDGSGNVYVADTYNNLIRKITSAGSVSNLAGQALATGSVDGTGNVARFNGPYGVIVDSAGNVYVGDTYNHLVRKITSGGAVSTLAGQAGIHGTANGTGTSAQFYDPIGLAVDGSGNVYVADTYNHLIRKITSGGVVTTLVGQAGAHGTANGTGTSAQLYYPYGVALDSWGNLYVADSWNYLIRLLR